MSFVAIIGAGDVGAHLARALNVNHHVEVVRKRERPLEQITTHALDITDKQAVNAFVATRWQNAPEVVVYAVASPEMSESAYQAHYVDGLSHVLGALERVQTPPKRVLFVSSTSVYHQTDGQWVDEQSPTEPKTYSGLAMLHAEQLLAQSTIKGVAVRSSGIYGPNRERLINHASNGGDCAPRLWSNRIHRDDLVGLLTLLVERALHDEPLDDVYLATDHEPAPLDEVLAFLRGHLGVAKIDPSVPFMSRRSTRRCSNQRVLDLGYRFLYPTYQEGYGALLASKAE